MVIERLARDAAADARLAVLPPESDGIAGIAAERLVGKDKLRLSVMPSTSRIAKTEES